MKIQNLAIEQIPKDEFDKIGEDHKTTNLLNLNRIFERSYPNLQYFCPRCSTLDVVLDLRNPDLLSVSCLECKNKWMEEYVN